MKNIYLLPTTGPSRIKGDGYSLELSSKALCWRFAKHIYITSSEKIVDGDWMIRENEEPSFVSKDFFWDFGIPYKKIILTTDPKLHLSGVQPINNEFIKWLTQNPLCEFVDVERSDKNDYKIIIPSTRIKQIK